MKKLTVCAWIVFFYSQVGFCVTYNLGKQCLDSHPYFAHKVQFDNEAINSVNNLDDLLDFFNSINELKISRQTVEVDQLSKMDLPLFILRPQNNEFFVLLSTFYRDDSNELFFQVAKGDFPPAMYSKSEFSRLFNSERVEVCLLNSIQNSYIYGFGDSHIEIDRMFYNFGYLKRDNKGYIASFTIRNIGGNPIIVGDPQTSCSCTTVASTTKGVLQPEEERTIQIRVSAPKGDEEAFLNKVLMSFTDSGTDAKHNIMWYLSGNIEKSPIKVIPSALDFGEIVEGKKYNRSIRLAGVGNTQFKVLHIEGLKPYIKTEIKRITNSNGRQEYLIPIDLRDWPDTPSGKETIIIKTDFPKQKIIHVPVKAEKVLPFSISPSKITWGFVNPGETKTKEIQIQHCTGLPFDIVDISHIPSITVDLLEEKSKANKKYIRIQKHFANQGIIEEEIQFNVKMGEISQDLNLPIYSIVKKGS
jgi:hypothetical protein